MNIQTMMYKDLEWYIINETEKEKLLFLKDCFTNEMIEKFFDQYNNYHVDYYIVRFSNDKYFNGDISKYWGYSYIRGILNGPFLNFLDINDLNVMTSNIVVDNELCMISDYVRLITKKEVEKLPIEILKSQIPNAYWTMNTTDCYIYGVFGTSDNPKKLTTMSPYSFGAIRPVISLKNNNIITQEKEIITAGYTPEQLENIKKLQKLHKL